MKVQISSNVLAATRYGKATIIANGDPMARLAFCEEMVKGAWRDTPSVALAAKAAIDPMSTGNTGPLSPAQAVMSGFIELVRARELINRIPGFIPMPLNVTTLKVGSAAASGWMGEGSPAPVRIMSLERLTLGFFKARTTVVITNELARAKDPLSDALFAFEFSKALAQFSDAQMFDPSYGPIADVSPGSITHGLTPISSTGSSLAQVQADIRSWFANFVAVDGQLESAVIVAAPRTAMYWGMLTGSSGAPVFPNVGPKGGNILGVPVFTSIACIAAGSPGEAFAVLFDPGQVMMNDSGDVNVEAARHASLQLNDAPAAGATSLTSLWQNGLVALAVERDIVWKRTSDTGIAVMRDITY